MNPGPHNYEAGTLDRDVGHNYAEILLNTEVKGFCMGLQTNGRAEIIRKIPENNQTPLNKKTKVGSEQVLFEPVV